MDYFCREKNLKKKHKTSYKDTKLFLPLYPLRWAEPNGMCPFPPIKFSGLLLLTTGNLQHKWTNRCERRMDSHWQAAAAAAVAEWVRVDPAKSRPGFQTMPLMIAERNALKENAEGALGSQSVEQLMRTRSMWKPSRKRGASFGLRLSPGYFYMSHWAAS